MVALPIAAATISLIFTVVITSDAVRRPRPHTVAWAIAFAIFTVAASAEVVGHFSGWTPLIARTFYLTGAVLVTAFLGLGEIYLLFGRHIRRFAPGITMAVVTIAASLVWSAPIDDTALSSEKWEAIERGTALITLVALSNAFGVLALAGGAGYSAWRYRRSGTHRHRMIGCILITVGTLVIASKGYLERGGLTLSDDAFYGFLTAGSAIIFLGYLETRRPEIVHDATIATLNDAKSPATLPPTVGASSVLSGTTTHSAANGVASVTPNGQGAHADPRTGYYPAISRLADNGHTSHGTMPDDPNAEAITFIETRFLPLDDGELDRLAAAWSAPRLTGTTLTRGQAQGAWALRRKLSPDGKTAFDRHGPAAMQQLVDLYFGVLAATPAHEARTREHQLITESVTESVKLHG